MRILNDNAVPSVDHELSSALLLHVHCRKLEILEKHTTMDMQAPVPEIRRSSYSPMKIANWTRYPIQMAIYCFV